MSQANENPKPEEFKLNAKEAYSSYQASRLLKNTKASFQVKTRNGRTWFNHIERTLKDGKRLYNLQLKVEDKAEKTKLVEADEVLIIRIQKAP
jgi:hypothetical protein